MIEKIPGLGRLSQAEKAKLAERMQFTVDFTYAQIDRATDPIKVAGARPDEHREFEMIKTSPEGYLESAKWVVKAAMKDYGIDQGDVDFRSPDERLGAANRAAGLLRSDFKR